VAADRIGLRHAGVFGRRAGSAPSIDYSPALNANNVVWDAKMLAQWLGNPESPISAQRMGYRVNTPPAKPGALDCEPLKAAGRGR
jgi:cytochrome c